MALPDPAEAIRADLLNAGVTDADIQASDPTESQGTSQSPPPNQPRQADSAAAQVTQPSAASEQLASGQTIPPTPAAPATQPTAAEAFISIRDAAKGIGLDLSQYPDDESALRALAAQAQTNQQLQQLAQYGQTYLQNAAEFEKWRAEHSKPAPAQQPEHYWKPPEFDSSWRHQIAKDAQGNWTTIPGADPAILPKFIAYANWRDRQQDNFWQDPVKAIQPGIESLIESKARQLFQQEMGAVQEQQYADRFLTENQQWLMQHDPKGNVLHDTGGRPMLADAGKQFYGYLRYGQEIGIQGHQRQAEYARSMVNRDMLARQVQSTPQATNQEIKDRVMQQQAAATSQPNHSASTAPATNGRGGVQNGHLSLADMLRADLKAGGVTDADIAETSVA